MRSGSLRETSSHQLLPDLPHPYRTLSSSSSSSYAAASVTPDDQADLLPLSNRDPDPQHVPGFLESSQESGFYSEDSEENKPSPASVHLWDTREEDNNTGLDSESLIGGDFNVQSVYLVHYINCVYCLHLWVPKQRGSRFLREYTVFCPHQSKTFSTHTHTHRHVLGTHTYSQELPPMKG